MAASFIRMWYSQKFPRRKKLLNFVLSWDIFLLLCELQHSNLTGLLILGRFIQQRPKNSASVKRHHGSKSWRNSMFQALVAQFSSQNRSPAFRALKPFYRRNILKIKDISARQSFRARAFVVEQSKDEIYKQYLPLTCRHFLRWLTDVLQLHI